MPPSDQKQRRARLQLSCQPCRIGKLKCNRELPCEQCVKRSRETSCVYSLGAHESISFKTQAKAMRDKLENLERTVQQFRKAEQHQPPGADPLTCDGPYYGRDGRPTQDMSPDADSQVSSAQGQINGETFVGPSHWESIISDIEEVKAYLDYDGSAGISQSPEASAVTSPSVAESPPDLHFRTPTVTRQMLIESVPQKQVADRLITAYLGSMDIYKPLIHVPTFQSQYQHFWRDPDSASIVWISLLLNILALGFQYTLQIQAPNRANVGKNAYLELAASAIVLADYTRPRAYTIESLVLYIRCCQMQNSERQFKDWLTLGLIVRLCVRMGYHRDPSHFPEINAFDGEMRRRVWMLVTFLDVTQSYTIGLISVIGALNSHVSLPRNLLDVDFGPETAELPPSRPPSDWTVMAYSIHKGRLLPIFAKAVKLSHSFSVPSLSEVYQVADRLQEVQDEIPPPLVIVPPDQALADSPDLITKRFGMEILAQKTRCVLFRRYLGTQEVRARKACVHAALRTMQIHGLMEDARMPGGPLGTCPAQQMWDLMDSFLLAAIIIALELSAIERANSIHDSSPYAKDECMAMTIALKHACDLWEQSSIAPEKSKRVARALAGVWHARLAPRFMGGEYALVERPAMDQGMSPGSRGVATAHLDDLLGSAACAPASTGWLRTGNFADVFEAGTTEAPQGALYQSFQSPSDLEMDLPLQVPMNIDWVSFRPPPSAYMEEQELHTNLRR